MTVLDDSPRTTGYSFRLQRRHEIVTTGGMEGVLRVGAALRASVSQSASSPSTSGTASRTARSRAPSR